MYFFDRGSSEGVFGGIRAEANASDEGPFRRAVDISFVLLATPVVVPFCLLAALLFKAMDPKGSIFFGVKRYGKDGRSFRMWKFRTMRNDFHLVRCEEIIRKFAPEVDFKLKNDPRISPLGAVFRRTHLDELPQLFNVLMGDMTLVGPRPNSLPPAQYKSWQLERLSVRPGLTGPWQLHGKRTVGYDERFAEEIDYIRNRTAWSEIKIVLETVWHCLNRRGMT